MKKIHKDKNDGYRSTHRAQLAIADRLQYEDNYLKHVLQAANKDLSIIRYRFYWLSQ